MTQEERKIITNAKRYMDYYEREELKQAVRRHMESEHAREAYTRLLEEHLRKELRASDDEREKLRFMYEDEF